MIIGALIEQLTQVFASDHIDEPKLTAELLIADVLLCPRLELIGQPQKEASPDQQQRIEMLAQRICTHEPLQYVLGSADFLGHDIATDTRALIPRPETEQLVELVLACPALWQCPNPRLVDVGTGSGCIIISLAAAHPDASCIATDFSIHALELAHKNAVKNQVHQQITWQHNDLLDGFQENSLDAIIANLPYISTEACRTLPRNVREFEPISALDGGEDGLELISRLVHQGAKTLNSTGWLFLEIGEEQGQAVEMLLENTGYKQISIKKDWADRTRFAIACRS